jgi:hypothetical protein
MDAIKSQLHSDERIIWEGKPDKRSFLFLGPSWFIIPFTILWCGFAIFWEVGVWASGAPAFFLIFGGVFVLIGLYITIGRFFVAGKEWEHLQYVLTNKRALIQQGAWSVEFQSVDLNKVDNIELHLRSSGKKGDIIFGSNGFMRFYIPGWPMMRGFYGIPPAFYAIDGAQELYKKINELKAGH